MGKPKKILVCAAETYPNNSGQGRNAFNFAGHLAEYYHTTLLTLNKNLRFKSKEIINNVTIKRIPYFNYCLVTKALSLLILIPAYIYNLLRCRIVLVYGKYLVGHEFIIFTGSILGRTIIFRSSLLNNDDIYTLTENAQNFKWLKKCIYRKIDIYFSLNPELSKRYLMAFPYKERIFEHTQGVDCHRFFPVDKVRKRELRRELNLPEEVFLIISIGNLIPRKRYEEIFEYLSGVAFPFLYVVIGEHKIDKSHYLYPRKRYIEDIYNEGRELLTNNIQFLGITEQVPLYFQTADVFVLNSREEGVPNVLLEAMACGTLPLIRDIPGVTGYLVEDQKTALIYHNEKEFHHYLSNIFFGAYNLIRQNAAGSIKEWHSMQAIAKALYNKTEYGEDTD